MPSSRFKIIPSVYAIIVKNEKILLARRCNTGYEDGNYGLVAGHAEAGETFRGALHREVKEEIGIDIDPSDMKHVLTLHRSCGDHERIDIFFEVKQWKGEIENREPDKCDSLEWFALDDLPSNTIVYIAEALKSYQNGTSYNEFGWSI